MICRTGLVPESGSNPGTGNGDGGGINSTMLVVLAAGVAFAVIGGDR